MRAHELYRQAQERLDGAAGYYNNNVRVDTPSGPVNVRIPIEGAASMDLRLWPEHEVLAAIEAYVDNAPRLLDVSREPPFQVHEFIEGRVLNGFAPRGTPVPDHVPADVAHLFTQLATVPADRLPPTPEGWPRDTTGFARELSGLTARVYERCREEYAGHFASLGIPADPLAPALDALATLSARPLVCVHADVHRKNIIIDRGRSVFLDWELTLWGDPLYDVAVHLHKMTYLPPEQETLLRLWQEAMASEHTEGWSADLAAYLTHEQVKSAIVDTVRYSQSYADPARSPEPRAALVAKLTGKLNTAYRHWETRSGIDEAEVDAILSRWASRR